MAKRYLTTIPLRRALSMMLRHISPMKDREIVSTDRAKGRLTAEAVFAIVSSPPYTCASMDGYAVDYNDTLSADVTKPLSLEKGTRALAVNTGDPLPEGTNGVIMREEVEETASAVIIRQPAYLWQNVRLVGEDIIERDLLLPANHHIGSLDLALLIAGGVTALPVRRRPRVAIIPTGKEITDIFSDGIGSLTRGRLIDVDSYVLAGLAEDVGFDVLRKPIVGTKEEVGEALGEALGEADAVCVVAGSSAGSEDFTEDLICEKGKLIFHGISLMPGKPAMFGIINGKPVFGIPGYPVSAVIAFNSLVGPAYERMMGVSLNRETVSCVPAAKMPSKMGMAEAVRVNLLKTGHTYYALPLPRGASILSSLAKADGIITVPPHLEGIREGEKVSCRLLVPKSRLENRIHIVGSHDLSLDVLRDLLRTSRSRLDLVASQAGSEGGILAVRKGFSHLATTHVIDEKEGIYNVPLAIRYLGDRPWVLVHIARRSQGIVTAPGNPLGINSVRDLTRPGLRFINRQFGSGTRILFDMMLRKEGINGSAIRGYDREESSHTAVGLLVKEGVADAGMAIYGAAHIFSLRFIPVAEEEYDLLVTEEFTKTKRFTMLLQTIESDVFRDRLERLGGYDPSDSGKVKYKHVP